MRTVILIAKDNIRALLHQRLLVGLMLASLALIVVFSIILSSARKNIERSYSDDATVSTTATNHSEFASTTNSLSEKDRRQLRESMDQASSYTQAFFYQFASFGGSLLTLFIFGTAVVDEIRKGTVRLTLSKPVSRTQFFLGKYLGGISVMAAYAIIVSLAMLVFAGLQGVNLNPAVKWAPWLMFCRQLMLGSVAMLLSLYMHPIIACLIAFFAGNGFCSPSNPLYYLLPSYKDFNVFFEVIQGTLISAKDVGFLSLYALDFIVIML